MDSDCISFFIYYDSKRRGKRYFNFRDEIASLASLLLVLLMNVIKFVSLDSLLLEN